MWSIAERSTRGRSIDFDCTFAAIHVMLEFVWRKKWRIHSCDSDTLQHMLCWACDVYCIKNREYRHFPMFFCCCLIICASFSHMTWHFDFELGAFMGIPFRRLQCSYSIHLQTNTMRRNSRKLPVKREQNILKFTHKYSSFKPLNHGANYRGIAIWIFKLHSSSYFCHSI